MTWYGLICFVLFVSILASTLSRFQLAIILASHHATKILNLSAMASGPTMPAAGSPTTFAPAWGLPPAEPPRATPITAPWNLPPAEPSPVSEPEAPPAKRARVVAEEEEVALASKALEAGKWARLFAEQTIYEAVMASGLNSQAREALLAAPTFRAAECRGHWFFGRLI